MTMPFIHITLEINTIDAFAQIQFFYKKKKKKKKKSLNKKYTWY